jgi:dienelactone hydrolase
MGHLAHGPANRGRRVSSTAAPLFVCEPRGAVRGGAVVVHDVFGLTHSVEAVCQRLARDGWLAVAPFLYHGHGGPVFGASWQAAARAEFASLSLADASGDIAAAVSYLAGRACTDTVAIGFGAGGHLAARAVSSAATPLLELPGDLAKDDLWRRVGAFLTEAFIA